MIRNLLSTVKGWFSKRKEKAEVTMPKGAGESPARKKRVIRIPIKFETHGGKRRYGRYGNGGYVKRN